MKKRELEERVLKIAGPLLEKLYGKFSYDPTQTDRPDAAIIVYKPHKRFGSRAGSFRVGVEITTVDNAINLAYLNDKKYGLEKFGAQAMAVLENSCDNDKPIKKAEIEVTRSYIYDGAIKKIDKYSGYFEAGNFREIILLCFSDVVVTDSVLFREQLLDYTNHLLSKAQFPFDMVVFVSLRNGKPVRVYRKCDPLLTPPALPYDAKQTETVVYGPTMRIGQAYNLSKIMSNTPLIAQRQRTPVSDSDV